MHLNILNRDIIFYLHILDRDMYKVHNTDKVN